MGMGKEKGEGEKFPLKRGELPETFELLPM